MALTRKVTIDRKVLVVHLSLFLVTLSVFYVMEVIRTKELVMLRAKDVCTVAN